MITLQPFTPAEFGLFASWIDSRELLIRIAGHYFTYPLTAGQLQTYLAQENSRAFNLVEQSSGKVIGHAELILLNDKACKIDKLIIGDTGMRGKGMGQQAVNQLLKYAFETLALQKTELYVYDWNTSAIRSYEKAGFVTDHDTQLFTEVEGETWKALRMVIARENWLGL
jgi:RimJ/RimL family protein N-acetyltransferase